MCSDCDLTYIFTVPVTLQFSAVRAVSAVVSAAVPTVLSTVGAACIRGEQAFSIIIVSIDSIPGCFMSHLCFTIITSAIIHILGKQGKL